MKIEARERIHSAYKAVTPGTAKAVFNSLLKELYEKLEEAPFFQDLPMTKTQITPNHLRKSMQYFFKNADKKGIILTRNVFAFGFIAGKYKI